MQLCEAALARIKALEKLVVCYRLGTKPTEKLHKELADTKHELEKALNENI